MLKWPTRNSIAHFLLLFVILLAGCKTERGKDKGTKEPEQEKKGIKLPEIRPEPIQKREAKKGRTERKPAFETPEDMLPVPGGTFTMGLEHNRAIPDEAKEHEVTLKGFLLDRTEVTNRAYQECVKAGTCREPKEMDTTKQGFARLALFRRPDHPVTGISQKDASTFCRWKKKRLPTEAEFERAARGDDGRLFAWGDEWPDAHLAVFGIKATAPVGSKPEGAGPFGHLDLAGNVWEWTSDLYDPFAYRRETAKDGIPADCETILKTQRQLRREGKEGFTGTNPIPRVCDHVLRGGAFNYFPWGLRASNRVHHPGSWRMMMAGFRCAMSCPPTVE